VTKKELKEILQTHVANVLNEAKLWRSDGPKSQIEHIDSSTIFGIEIECFVPRNFRDMPSIDGSNHGNFNYNILFDRLYRGDISLENISSALNCSIVLLEEVKDNRLDFENFMAQVITTRPSSISELNDLLNYNSNFIKSLLPKFDRPAAQALLVSKYPEWRWIYDTTVSESQDEIVSPKLFGRDGLLEIKRILRTLKETGFNTDDSCGAHTSLTYNNGLGYYTAPLALLTLWANCEPELHKILPNFRSNIDYSRWVSKDLKIKNMISRVASTKARALLNSLKQDPGNKYRALSIRYFKGDESSKRVEFRVWDGTLDYDTWAAQIGFGKYVLMQAALLSRVFSKVRKEHVENSINKKDDYVRQLTNEEFIEQGTRAGCNCEPCKLVAKEYPKDYALFVEYSEQEEIMGNNWLSTGHETAHDM